MNVACYDSRLAVVTLVALPYVAVGTSIKFDKFEMLKYNQVNCQVNTGKLLLNT